MMKWPWRRHSHKPKRGPTPWSGTMGKLAPTINPAVSRMRKEHPCDRCGVSKIDGGHIANARYEVRVPGGSLYLCGSHMRRHWTHATEMQYVIVSLDSASTD